MNRRQLLSFGALALVAPKAALAAPAAPARTLLLMAKRQHLDLVAAIARTSFPGGGWHVEVGPEGVGLWAALSPDEKELPLAFWNGAFWNFWKGGDRG